jgi:hypothetical protein
MIKRSTFFLAALATGVLLLETTNSLEAADSPGQHEVLSKETRAILDASENFVLISLEPIDPFTDADRTDKRKPDKRKRFQSYPVLGEIEIKDPKLKGELLAGLYAGVEKYQREKFSLPTCFFPRHGIRAVSGTNWVELVICFSCKQISASQSDGKGGWSGLSNESRRLFNRTLREARVLLAK